VLFFIEPTILVILILASQEISCPLFCSSLYFMQNIPISKTLFVVTQLVWFKVSLVRSRLTDIRLAQTLTLRGLPCLTCVQPTCPTLFNPLEFNLWIYLKLLFLQKSFGYSGLGHCQESLHKVTYFFNLIYLSYLSYCLTWITHLTCQNCLFLT
jgi:hypothetical protein